MSYLDRLKPGSFRGVPFFTPEHSMDGGHRGTVHEYPGSDDHTSQSLGKSVKTFSVTAVLIGADYDLIKNQLIEALDKGGPGKLVHRYLGEFDAEVEPGKRYTLRESEGDGARCVFTIPFIRSGAAKSPSAKADSRQLVKATATATRTYARAKFYAEVDQHGPEWLRDQMLDAVNTASSAMRSVARTVNGTLGYVSGVEAAIDNFANAAATMISSPTVVLEIADEIIAITLSIFEAFITVGQAAADTVNAFRGQPSLEAATAAVESRRLGRSLAGSLRDINDTESVALDETTDLTAQSTTNAINVSEVMKASAAAAAVEAALSIPYDSQTTANNVRDAVCDIIQGIADATTGDDLYAALVDMRAAFYEHMSLLAGSLPSPATYVPRSAMPALLVAHLVHGDARRVDEIVVRNNVRHPGFCLPGVELEVIT